MVKNCHKWKKRAIIAKKCGKTPKNAKKRPKKNKKPIYKKLGQFSVENLGKIHFLGRFLLKLAQN